MNSKMSQKLQDYLNKISDIKDDHCWFCQKTPDQIRAQFLEYLQKNPDKADEIDLDDVIMISYRTKKPICASCYFVIRDNPELVREILHKSPDKVW
ncbi:MAG: hypothetical protein Q8Q08_11440 [Candidatus Omnitrophota bacterium]|nr:hypothetical protein [Candidatus Omnitrophota bacterium]MDZ4243313.1 hypothetical protein [Candidatus Omnitrophota bacterium]